MNNLDYGILNGSDISEGNLFQNNNEIISFKNHFEKLIFEKVSSIQYTEYLDLLEKAKKRDSNSEFINDKDLNNRILDLKNITIFFEEEFHNNKFIKSFSDYYFYNEEDFLFNLKTDNPYLNFKLLEEELFFIKKNLFKLNRAKRLYFSLFNS